MLFKELCGLDVDGLNRIGFEQIYLAGLRRAEREDPAVHGGLANSAEFAGVATQSQQDESEALCPITKTINLLKVLTV